MKPIYYTHHSLFVWQVIPVCVCAGLLLLFPASANAQKNVLKQLFKKPTAAQQATVRRFAPSGGKPNRCRQNRPRKNRAAALPKKPPPPKPAGLTEHETPSLAPFFHVPNLKKIPPVIITDFSDYLPPVQLPAP